MKNELIKTQTCQLQSQNLFGGNLIESFIRFAGVSEKSASTYKIALRQLAKYFALNSIIEPARQDLEIWRDNLIADNKKPATVQLYLTSAKIFFRWLAQEGFYKNIADHLKVKVKIGHDHKKDALTSRQAGNLIQSVGKTFQDSIQKALAKKDKRFRHNELKAKRDRAIVALMTSCGLRCVEVYRSDIQDLVNQFGKTYLLIQGKGHCQKDSKVLVPAQVEKLIREYLTARADNNPKAPLFTSTANCNRGQRLSTQSISKMVKARLRAVGMDTPRLTAHSLRHTAATTMILAGVELTKVQQILRHVNINTTMIYNNAVERMKNMGEQAAADAIFNSISA